MGNLFPLALARTMKFRVAALLGVYPNATCSTLEEELITHLGHEESRYYRLKFEKLQVKPSLNVLLSFF